MQAPTAAAQISVRGLLASASKHVKGTSRHAIGLLGSGGKVYCDFEEQDGCAGRGRPLPPTAVHARSNTRLNHKQPVPGLRTRGRAQLPGRTAAG